MTGEDLDHTPLDFGKYRGKTPDQVAEFDDKYICWMYENVVPCPVSKVLYEACRMDDADENDGEDDGIFYNQE